MIDDDVRNSRRPVFFRALRSAIARAPLWLTCWFVPFLIGLVLTAPWMRWTSEAASHYPPRTAFASMDVVFRQDHGESLERLRDQGGAAAAMAALGLMAFGMFSAGGWLQIFLARTGGRSVRRFFWGGARYFWRFARVWVLTLVSLALAGWIAHGWPYQAMVRLLFDASMDTGLEEVTSEWTATWIRWFQAGIFAAMFALLMIWGDYTRTRLALHDGRSALWAGLCTWFLIIAHPVRTLRPMLFVFGLEVLVVWIAGTSSWEINAALAESSSWTSILWLFLIGQFTLMWQAICRGARYSAAVQVSQQLVAPLAQPDPWASRIGGPGGPQYPIDEGDGYGVSI